MSRVVFILVVSAAIFAASMSTPTDSSDHGSFLGAAAKLVAIQEAQAHGRHHSPIRPAYDCYRNTWNPGGPDTEGDVVTVVDLDLGVYIVYKCICKTSGSQLVCYWIEVNRYKYKGVKQTKKKAKAKAIKRMEHLTRGPLYGTPMLRRIKVTWTAHHWNPITQRYEGCHLHKGRRYAVVVRRR